MSLPKKQQRLLQLIECPVCLNELQDPRMLSCRHALCYTCVKDYTEKNKYNKELPCPVCREVTTLHEGGVDNLPKFFFMNELKEVVMEEDGVKEDKPQAQGGAVCSTEDCGQPAIKYCKDGCQFICQECYDEHQSMRITRKHQVITASEGEAFTKSKVPPYPPCHRHNHQVLDLYCRKCNIPICTTCCHLNHRDHDFIEIDKQADTCKTKLEQICEDTDGLIHQVKQAIDKTKCQAQQAETGIDEMCNNVKSTFKIIHDQLDEEEKKMLSDLQEARRRVKKTVDVITDSQMMTLATMESLRSCETKLADKDSPYDYVTVTDSLERDVEIHSQELPGLSWSSKTIKKAKIGEMIQGRVEIKESELVQKKQEEVGRIRLHNQDEAVLGMVVYKERVYVVHQTGLVVYCYNPDGSLSDKYEHEGGADTVVHGMCLMMDGDTPMLVVSDFTNASLIWIRITADFTMKHHNSQQLDFSPCGLYNDRGDLMVSDAVNHKIHRYTGDGQPLSVIAVPDDVKPHWVIWHGYSDQYVVTDFENHQVAVIDGEGQVKTRYKGDIHGVKVVYPWDITTDKQGRILIVDNTQHHVLLMSRKREEVKQLIQGQVMIPTCLCLDEESHKMYVAAKDDQWTVFYYDYIMLTGGKTFTEKITKLDILTVM